MDGLPEWAREYDAVAYPSIIFPWRSPSGVVVEQVRPDVPVVYDEEERKYLWPAGQGSVLATGRADPDADVVLIVEGTKQTLAAASWAPIGVAVYGIGGCRNWSSEGIPLQGDLAVVEGRHVVIALDADVATNLDVYQAGVKLAEAVIAEGARDVRFFRLAASGTNGLDDVLGARAPESRTAYVERLIKNAKTKPADSRPKAKARAVEQVAPTLPDTGGRPMVYVDGDRWGVINELIDAIVDRWDRRRLFNHGGQLSQLIGDERKLELVDDKKFGHLIQETVATVRRVGRAGGGEDVRFDWPDERTIKSVASQVRRFAPVVKVSTAPFVRQDGSICQVDGYDEASQVVTMLGRELGPIDVPVDPTPDHVAQARKLLLDDWLVDFSFKEQADRANALGLVITPFVRSMMRVVPLAVIDGLCPSSGKGLFADVVTRLFTGAGMDPIGWNTDDAEFRKVLTSAFLGGPELLVFDEAHYLDGLTLARALTAETYVDRILGGNTQIKAPNRATWMSLGNNVRVEGDIFRRVYRIALHPEEENPEDRNLEAYRHPNLVGWTMDNRAELIGAVLTLVRSWFVAGKPRPARGSTFGSFEEWERVVGGIVDNAGVPGFLDNLRVWRRESNLDGGYWETHLAWLSEMFGPAPFTSAEVRDKLAGTQDAQFPPKIKADLSDRPSYSKALGEAYNRHRDRAYSGLRLRRDGEARGGRARWVVEPTGGPDADGVPVRPVDGSLPEGSGGSGGTSLPPAHTREKTFFPGDAPDDGAADETRFFSRVCEGAGAPSTPSTPSGASDTLPHPPIDLATWTREGSIELPPGVVVIDIETTGNQLWPLRPDFIRITGVQRGRLITVHADAAEVAELLREAELIVGHNLMSFDLLAFALHHGVDIHQLAEEGRLVDTMLTEILVHPPEARTKVGQIMRATSLDALALDKLGVTKSVDVRQLAKEFGGFDQIPQDDPRYAERVSGDVDLTAQIAHTQPRTAYARREHRVAAIAAQVRINGFRVDLDLLHERLTAGHTRRVELISRLRDRYGLPTTTKDGKSPSKSPHATEEGRAAIVNAFSDLGVTLPRTAKGKPALAQDALATVAETHADNPEVLELVETVQALNGVRTVYDTIERCRVGDRVHPDITMCQASGRWSITEPGLTVMGKRGGKHVERDVFLPEPGHVIIAADLSQVDARAVAAHCQDPAYLALFEPGRDSHTEIAIKVWGDPSRRDDAKVLGHGWNYGMGIANLARKIGSEDVAREFDRSMKEQFPILAQWKRDVAAWADSGELMDNGFGRKLRTTPGAGWTQGPALMGQSAARDIMMQGLLRLPRPLLAYLRAVVHDEIVMSIPADQADEIEAQVLDALSFEWAPRPGLRTVRIEAGLAERGSAWGQCYVKKPKPTEPNPEPTLLDLVPIDHSGQRPISREEFVRRITT